MYYAVRGCLYLRHRKLWTGRHARHRASTSRKCKVLLLMQSEAYGNCLFLLVLNCFIITIRLIANTQSVCRLYTRKDRTSSEDNQHVAHPCKAIDDHTLQNQVESGRVNKNPIQ